MDSCQETETRNGGKNGEGAVVFAEGVELDQETAPVTVMACLPKGSRKFRPWIPPSPDVDGEADGPWWARNAGTSPAPYSMAENWG